MSGADNVVITTLERASSGDINDLQSLEARFLSDMARFLLQKRGRGGFSATDSLGVIAGMPVSASGSDVVVGPGFLMQYNASLAPTPGPLDSPYRLARNGSAATVTGPSPGATSWYLLEAQMQDVIASAQSRDVFNPTTQMFVPTSLTVQRNRTVNFQLTLGTTTNIPLTTAGWVPVAGVQFPGGGGAPLSIIDLRPLPEVTEVYNIISRVEDSTWNTISTPSTPSNSIYINSMVVTSQCGPMFANPGLANVDVTAAEVLSPGTALTANTWYYLYLSPWSDAYIKPRAGATALRNEGVLVLSSIAPVAGRAFPATPIPLPAPYATGTLSAGAELSIVCVGALRRNGTNDGWLPSDQVGKRSRIPRSDIGNALRVDTTTGPVGSTLVVSHNLAGFVPTNARSVRLRFSISTPVANTGGGPWDLCSLTYSAGGTWDQFLIGGRGIVELDYSIVGTGLTFTSNTSYLSIASPVGDITLNTYVIGWEY